MVRADLTFLIPGSLPLTGEAAASHVAFQVKLLGLDGRPNGSLHGALRVIRRLDDALTHDNAAAATAIATTVAAIAAVAAAVAAIPTVATIAAMAAIASVAAVAVAAVAAAVAAMTTAMASAITIRAAATSAARASEQASLGLAIAADQRNADQGEKQSNTEHNNAIHPQVLQLLTGTVS